MTTITSVMMWVLTLLIPPSQCDRLPLEVQAAVCEEADDAAAWEKGDRPDRDARKRQRTSHEAGAIQISNGF